MNRRLWLIVPAAGQGKRRIGRRGGRPKPAWGLAEEGCP